MNTGVLAIIASAPHLSGVYKMYNNSGEIIYIGKAKNLYKRLQSYTKISELSSKTRVLVQSVANIEIEITKSESEALILEASLVKKHQPKYNILLKDDKSRVYIKITTGHKFAAITRYRGRFDARSHLFGPFGYIQCGNITTNDIIKNLILFVNKVFKIRSCKDSKFSVHQSMGKPCMEYQIKTCSGPCAAMIMEGDYQKSVDDAIKFLQGNYNTLERDIKKRIEFLSANTRYAEAGVLKNQILAIERLRLASASINFTKYNNIDVIVLDDVTLAKLEVFSIRNGYAIGGNIFEINQHDGQSAQEIISSFLFEHYSVRNLPPKEIIVSCIENMRAHKIAIKAIFGITIDISSPKQGDGKKLIEFVRTNLDFQKNSSKNAEDIFTQGMVHVKSVLELDSIPERIEVYDNSHISGVFFTGAFIVATRYGFDKSSYRKFNAQKAKGGDDYAMMREVMFRRFGGSLVNDPLPDLLLIDGGLGQLRAVLNALDEINISIPVCSIAKGKDRNAGNETFFTRRSTVGFKITNKSALLFLQRIRDEAHRFVITSHRKRREKI